MPGLRNQLKSEGESVQASEASLNVERSVIMQPARGRPSDCRTDGRLPQGRVQRPLSYAYSPVTATPFEDRSTPAEVMLVELL